MECRLDVQKLLLGDGSLGVVLESVRVVLLDQLQVCRLGQTQTGHLGVRVAGGRASC